VAAVTSEAALRLGSTPGIGPTRIRALLDRFGTPARVLSAPVEALRTVPGVGEGLALALRAAAGVEGDRRVAELAERLRTCGGVALTPGSPEYPEAFRALSDAPYLLFARGDLGLCRVPAVAVVGTRTPSDYGRRATEHLVGDLARAGFAVVSGMARGIDAAAHAAALAAGGATIGVLGCGIDRAYPRENRALFERVAREGLLLSDYLPGEPPLAGNFPRRNRLVAALSEGVLVVEMGERSGALHTVRYALDLGKEVFAVPGPIGSPVSVGTNQLLKEGARVVTGSRDVLEELRGVGAVPLAGPLAPPSPADSGASRPAAELEALLGADAVHVDHLVERSGRTAADVLALLLELELAGAVEVLPGKRFRRPVPAVLP
jgi:DNA processing protein